MNLTALLITLGVVAPLPDGEFITPQEEIEKLKSQLAARDQRIAELEEHVRRLEKLLP